LNDPLEDHLLRQLDRSHRFFWHRARWQAVSTYLPRDEPFELVDVGAGAGLLATYLAQDRPLASYRFVEPLGSLRASLRERHGTPADAGDDPTYRTARFVTLLDVLEHQEDDRAFMSELVAKMTPGATLLLTVPSGEQLWSQWDVALGHFRRYTRESLLGCVDGLSLRVLEASYLFPELLPMAVLRARRLRPATVPATGGTVAAVAAPGLSADADESATFPELPDPVNDVLARASGWSVALRRHWATGTSLFLAGTVGDGVR
jgi:hypothetical protein